ncbi:MAG TPA: DUF2795 domain-containing protein [Pseudonocardia sp.]|nr:DUF2795 domain-containing protein [Pseudonocardia sp.]
MTWTEIVVADAQSDRGEGLRGEGLGGEGLRAVLAELSFPAPVWVLVAQAHSWGADAESVDMLSRLPTKDYQGVDDVLDALGRPRPAKRPRPPERPPVPPPPAASPGPARPGAAPDGTPTRPRGAAAGLNKAAQHKIVGEGLAVGLLALDVEAVTINRHLLESAFAHAWGGWTCSPVFPQVRAGAEHNDILAILRSSARRKGKQIANWSTEGEYSPRLRVSSTLDQAGLAVGKPAGIAYHQWLALARAFVSQLDEEAGAIRYRSGAP